MTRALRALPITLALAACGKSAPPASADAAKTSADSMEAIEASVESALDRSADACTDFYEFACGGWVESTELPADRPIYGRGFSTIADRNQKIVKSILKDAAAGNIEADPRLGAFYESCIDVDAIDAAGTAPLEADLAVIDEARDAKTLVRALTKLPSNGAFMGVFVEADFKNPDMNMLMVSQGGLGLPTRDDYFPEDEDGKSLLADYEAHVGKMLALAGLDAGGAAAVLAIETELAEASRPPAELRDATTMYHPYPPAELGTEVAAIPWNVLFAGLDVEPETVNVLTPKFFPAVEKVLNSYSIDDLKTYAKWHQITAMAPYLPRAFDQENFAFYSTRLSGQKEQQPRWKRCVNRTDGALGDLLGQAFVDEAFAGDSKAKALEMIRGIEAAFEAGLPELAWMDDETRGRALEKLHTITNKIGYPDSWETYEGVEVGTSHYDNVRAVSLWELKDTFEKVGQPVDKTEWFMTPPTVNAYYNPLVNEIVFPAGIMQPPFFSASFPTAMNYGAMGMVMGHEVTHGFDDEGRKFGPTGKLETWWNDEVSAAFEEEAACIGETYSAIEVQPGVFLNGDLTMGENIADFGGIKLASEAYAAWQAAGGTDVEALAGFTPEQLVFVGYAQSWCSIATPEVEKLRAKTDPHSPPRSRVNVPLAHLPAFHEAFGCDVGTPMHPEETCSVW